MTVTASITTADLHRSLPRITTHEGVSRLAAVHGRRVVGDRLTGPELVGDLASDVVALRWQSVPAPAPSEASPDEQAALWCSRLWEDRPGRAVVGYGHDGRYKPSGSYEFTRFEQRSYAWPDDRERLLTEALAAADTVDVYVAVLLRTADSRGRTKDTAAPGAVAWVDVDGKWTSERQSALDALGVESWHVESGARGGRHVYVPLGELVDPDRLEQVNRRLTVALGGDSGWERTKVLRLPGTLNHKPRPHGRPSAPVRWLP